MHDPSTAIGSSLSLLSWAPGCGRGARSSRQGLGLWESHNRGARSTASVEPDEQDFRPGGEHQLDVGRSAVPRLVLLDTDLECAEGFRNACASGTRAAKARGACRLSHPHKPSLRMAPDNHPVWSKFAITSRVEKAASTAKDSRPPSSMPGVAADRGRRRLAPRGARRRRTYPRPHIDPLRTE